MTVAAKVRKDHQFTSTSGPDIRHSGCTCGAITRWETRYADHADHVDEEIETAIRKQVAADIERRKRDLAEGYADMAKAMLEAGMEEAARIAEKGNSK